ncbi:type 2 DNA topoisomerase 6 subunit B-like [Dugong dugon]
MDPQGHTLLLFLFVDFHSGFPVQRMELWGVHTLLTTHLNAILLESQRVVQDSIQIAVDQALEQHHQAAKAHRKLQASHAVAVNSIMSVVIGSTNSSFRKMCLQAFQATDTREFGTKLHKAFNEITQRRFFHHCSCGIKQQLPAEKHDTAQSAEDACESRSPELLPETSAQAESKRCKKSADETRAFCSTRAASPPETAPRRPEPAAVSLGPNERQAGGEQLRAPAPRSTSPGACLEEALWLQEVSNLSEWLNAGPGP